MQIIILAIVTIDWETNKILLFGIIDFSFPFTKFPQNLYSPGWNTKLTLRYKTVAIIIKNLLLQ